MCLKQQDQPPALVFVAGALLVTCSRLLYDVHGFEIFHMGLFNSDPHAGNAGGLSEGMEFDQHRNSIGCNVLDLRFGFLLWLWGDRRVTRWPL